MSERGPRAVPADYLRRVLATVIAIVTLILFYFGTSAFAHTVTFSFSNAGFAIVPLGAFICGIFLLPLISQAHKLWLAGDPHKRAADRQRDEKEEKRMRLSTGDSPSVRRRREAEAERAEREGRARADALEQVEDRSAADG